MKGRECRSPQYVKDFLSSFTLLSIYYALLCSKKTLTLSTNERPLYWSCLARLAVGCNIFRSTFTFYHLGIVASGQRSDGSLLAGGVHVRPYQAVSTQLGGCESRFSCCVVRVHPSCLSLSTRPRSWKHAFTLLLLYGSCKGDPIACDSISSP